MPEFVGEAKYNAEPEGDYELVISKIIEEVVGEGRKSAGAPMWRCTYDVANTGRKIFDNLVFTPKSFWRISNWWRALGHEVVPGQPIDTGAPEDYIGCTVRAHLIVTTFNGAEQNDVAYFIEPTPGQNLPVVQKSEVPPDNLKF